MLKLELIRCKLRKWLDVEMTRTIKILSFTDRTF